MLHSYRTPAKQSGCFWPPSDAPGLTEITPHGVFPHSLPNRFVSVRGAHDELYHWAQEVRSAVRIKERFNISVVFKDPPRACGLEVCIPGYPLVSRRSGKVQRAHFGLHKGLTGRGLLVNFHKQAKIAAWHQRNNDRSLQDSFSHMARSDQGKVFP